MKLRARTALALQARTLCEVRDVYAHQMSSLLGLLPDICAWVTTAMQMANQALLESDLHLAEQVLTDDERIDFLAADAEEQFFAILALQSPVATDLRLIATGVQITASLQRMGQLARHIAALVRWRHPGALLPPEVREVIYRMGRFSEDTAASLRETLITRDLELVRRLQINDVTMDNLREQLFTITLSPSWPYGVETAVNLTLLGRFYERFCDQAVYIASRIEFQVTGRQHSGSVPG